MQTQIKSSGGAEKKLNKLESNDKEGMMKSSVKSSKKSQCKNVSYKNYIHQLLKKVADDIHISARVVSQLNVIVRIMANVISEKARILTRNCEKQTVTVKEIMSSICLVIPQELLKNVTNDASQAINDYGSDNKQPGPRSKAHKAGIIFPPHLAEKALRQNGTCGLSIGDTATVYLAAVLQSLVTQIMDKVIVKTREAKKITINIRHLFLGVYKDENLAILFNNLGLKILGGGATPNIHKKSGKKDKLVKNKTLKTIKKYQKDTKLLLQQEPFKRFVKEQINGTESLLEELPNFSNGLLVYLQYYTEQELVIFIRKALAVTLHSGRDTLEAKDLELIRTFSEKAIYPVNDQGITELTEPGLRRLAFRAGVRRMSKNCLPVLREYICEVVSNIIIPSILTMKHQNVKTLTCDILRKGAEFIGINLPIENGKKLKNKKLGKKATDQSISIEKTESNNESDVDVEAEAVEEDNDELEQEIEDSEVENQENDDLELVE